NGPTHSHNHTLDLVITYSIDVHHTISNHYLFTFDLHLLVPFDNSMAKIVQHIDENTIAKIIDYIRKCDFGTSTNVDQMAFEYYSAVKFHLDSVAPPKTKLIRTVRNSLWFNDSTHAINNKLENIQTPIVPPSLVLASINCSDDDNINCCPYCFCTFNIITVEEIFRANSLFERYYLSVRSRPH
ncbi:hypothetical protein Z043_124910, partial [Scleropages formosus]